MSTMFADTLLIVFISVCTALLAEGEGLYLRRSIRLRVEGHGGSPRAPPREDREPHFLRPAWSAAKNPWRFLEISVRILWNPISFDIFVDILKHKEHVLI